MGIILKLAPDKYVDWSTVADGPSSAIMNQVECENYVRREMKRELNIQTNEPDEKIKKMQEELLNLKVQNRLERVEEKGSSAMDPQSTMENTVQWNRAGENEKCITLGEIIELYTYSPEKKGKFPFR